MNNLRFKARLSLLSFVLGAGFLGGCAPAKPVSGKNDPGRDPLRGLAASFLAARAFDSASLALERDDRAGLKRAGIELRRAADAGFTPRLSGAFASQLAIEANRTSQLASAARGDEMIELLQDSERNYRAALAFTPEKSPETVLDPITLNSLGYFLADQGTSPADFERAEVLTRAALRNWTAQQIGAEANPVKRANVQDSLAWALFKRGRLAQARKEQEQVWDLLRGLGATDTNGEIPFHLAEIYRALGLKEKARDTYRQALFLPIDARIRAKIESALDSLDLAQV